MEDSLEKSVNRLVDENGNRQKGVTIATLKMFMEKEGSNNFKKLHPGKKKKGR